MIEFAWDVFEVGAAFAPNGGAPIPNLSGVALVQIKINLQKIKKMVEIILSAPLETAIMKTLTALNLLQNVQIDQAVQEFRGALDDARQALVYAKKQGTDLEQIRQVSTATRIIVLAKLCIYSYDATSQTIEPFYVLDHKKQSAIANELERNCKEFVDYHQTVKFGFFNLNKETKRNELGSMKNSLLQAVYPYISEGKKYTCANRKLPLSFDIEYDPVLIPDGEENATVVILGTIDGGKKVREAFYKDTGERVVCVQSAKLGLYETKKSINTITVTRETISIVPKCAWTMKFVRTTDQEPIYFAKYLQTTEKNGGLSSLPFFLYRSINNAWFCSPHVGEGGDHPTCILRNLTLQNTQAVTDTPPLTGWEFFNEEEKWMALANLQASTFITLDSLDNSEFISKPWAALDRTNFRDEIVITASAKDIRNEIYFRNLCGNETWYEPVKVKKYRLPHSGQFIYKTAEGKWCISGKVGDENPFCYNDSAPLSDWPPATGWKNKAHKDLTIPIELKIKINQV